MIETASAAAQAGSKLTFCQGDIVDLSRFPDRSFDLVLCLDSPLSFCYPRQSTALAELVRVCRHSLVLCVMSRLGVIREGGMTFDLQHFGRPQTVREVFRTGDLLVTAELQRLQPLMPSWHAFTVEEIETLVADLGLAIRTTMAPGALASSVAPELLSDLFQRTDAYQEYLDFEDQFDSQRTVLGTAASGAGGIALVAHRAAGEP
jgi:hypothetical protein